MSSPNVLMLHCLKCKVSGSCPRSGSSPLKPAAGTREKPLFCRVVGGYGQSPVDRSILSEELAARSDKDGPCLTLAEVPTREPSGHVHFELVKVFHHPIVHPRSTTTERMDSWAERSHRQERPTRS
jgi:hypothetical protein